VGAHDGSVGGFAALGFGFGAEDVAPEEEEEQVAGDDGDHRDDGDGGAVGAFFDGGFAVEGEGKDASQER